MPADQQIRDKSHHLLETIKMSSSGKHEIRDRDFRLLGTYDPKTNETRDASFRLIAKATCWRRCSTDETQHVADHGARRAG